MKNFYYITIIGLLLLSCNRTKQSESNEISVVINQNREFLEIPVDIDQNYSLPLSEIAEEITAIELELTDESLINPEAIQRILVSEDHIIVISGRLGLATIHVFNKDGKFIRSIGSIGQGPGEYTSINSVALDEKNRRLFIATFMPNRIICYDLDGKFLNASEIYSQFDSFVDIHYLNDELLFIAFQMALENKIENRKVTIKHSLYRMKDDFQMIDNGIILKQDFETLSGSGNGYNYKDFIFHGNSSFYLYYCENYHPQTPPMEIVLRDTLYRYEDNQRIPDLKLKFKDNGIDRGGNKFIHLFNMFRSSRYVFSIYKKDDIVNSSWYHFCYDTKTGKGYNMQDGYTDDINGIEKRVRIRPLVADSELFYSLHTNMKPDDKEEPNPTLYIIKLKK